jgi:hypothetical protein
MAENPGNPLSGWWLTLFFALAMRLIAYGADIDIGFRPALRHFSRNDAPRQKSEYGDKNED